MPPVFAEDQVIDLNSPEAIRHTLEQQAGKRVTQIGVWPGFGR